MAISYLNFVMSPPDGCEFGVMWHEHDFGEYPSLGLYWGEPLSDAPWNFIHKCEVLLERFNEAISWHEIDPEAISDDLEDFEEEEEEVDDNDEYT